MIVIADTSPIHYLVLTGTIDVLSSLFSEIIVPPGVLSELRHAHAPGSVQDWAARLPGWVVVRSPLNIDPQLHLGRGETEAICLAMELQPALLLVDDRLARRAAESRGIDVVGTVGLLQAAAKRELIDLPLVIRNLRQTNFHMADCILDRLLAEDTERNAAPD